MAKPLQTAQISAPGFYGLNTQDASVDLESGFAVVADNAVIDKFGRIGARKGWTPASDSPAGLAGAPIEMIAELADLSGNVYTIVAGNNKLFKLVDGTLTELTYVGAGTAPTITASNWDWAALEGELWLYQEGHKPLVFRPTASTVGYYLVTDHPNYVAPEVQGNNVLAAYGRLWVATTASNKYTVYWSDTLKGANFGTGAAGSVELTSVFTNGMDEIVGIEAIAGLLIILCKRSVIIYQGAAVAPTTNLTLREVIKNVGCVGRDTVQNTGNDVIFLSESGVVSLQRLQDNDTALPFRDLSRNVRDDMIQFATQQSGDTYKSGYFPEEALYVLSNPVTKKCYVLDTRSSLQDGSARVTTWNKLYPTAFLKTRDYDFLLGLPGYVGKYEGYTDNGATYRLQYYTNYQNLQDSTVLKILKNIGMTVVGGSAQAIVIKWGFEYVDNYESLSNVLSTRGNVAYYNIAEYNEGFEYTSGIAIESFRIPASGSGAIIQIGVESDISGTALSVQNLRLYFKQGKVI